MIRINNIKIYKDVSDEEILNNVLKQYKMSNNAIYDWHISKKSIDARKKMMFIILILLIFL